MDQNVIAAKKKVIRKRMMDLRDAMEPVERRAQSERICAEIETLLLEREVRVLHSFLPMGSEVELFPLLDRAVAKGIAVYAPKSLKGRVLENYRYQSQEQLVQGVFGTRYPAGDTPYTGEYDLIIVPGLAFTPEGDRLGYGAGYYDTFLARHPNAYTAAVCFQSQVLPSLPVEAHDHAVKRVISAYAV